MYNVYHQKSKKLELLILIMCLSCIILFLIYSKRTAQRVYEGLIFCAGTIIPSVFPIMLITDILLRSGALSLVSTLLMPIMLKAKKNPAAAIPCLAGMICGFPIGAKIVRDMETNGEISKAEADHLLAASNCASPAFVISTVGAGMYSDIKLGISLWCVSTLTSLILSLWLLPEFDPKTQHRTKLERKNTNFAELFCTSAKNTYLSILNIVCLITFFYTVSETLGEIMSQIGASEFTVALASALLELGSGCSKSSILIMPYSVCLSAFAIGFSGICVYFQVKSEAHTGANMKIYLLIKTVCGLVSSLFAFFVLQI